MDGDDEVRDRATYYLQVLGSRNLALNREYVIEPNLVSLPLLEKSLKEYLNGPLEEPFNIFLVPKTVVQQEAPIVDPMIITGGSFFEVFVFCIT